jgi:hypothetical protein
MAVFVPIQLNVERRSGYPPGQRQGLQDYGRIEKKRAVSTSETEKGEKGGGQNGKIPSHVFQ